jgi:hypothetical protein
LAVLRETYEPRPLDVPTMVIVSEGFDEYALPTWYLRQIVRRPRSWRRLPGPHSRLLLPPNVDLVAAEIRAAVDDEARASRATV